MEKILCLLGFHSYEYVETQELSGNVIDDFSGGKILRDVYKCTCCEDVEYRGHILGLGYLYNDNKLNWKKIK